MNKIVLLILLATALVVDLSAQVLNRYPVVQSTTQKSVIIAWRRATSGVGKVKWGLSASSLNDSITETAAFQKHAITISGLQPNTQYFYQAMSDNFVSSVEYFYTAKPDSVRSLDFLVYGDCGFNNSQQDAIAAQMALKPSDFALVVGDVDQLVGNAYDIDYFQHYTNMLKHQCHYTAIGNHDVITNNTNYVDAFDLLHNNPVNSELYYSFTWGNAKFITISGNDPYTAGSAQYTWLESELKCNNSEWTFVYFHQPPWSNGWDVSYYIPFTPFYQYQGNTDMRNSLVPLFEKYHVDAVLNGHTHNYERGIYHGVRYFITGGGAASTPDTHTNSNAPNIQLELNTNEFMHWTILGDVVHYETIDINGAIIDSVTFGKSFIPYSVNVSARDETCLAVNGSAAVTVAGPHPLYTFSWSNSATTDTIHNLRAGAYAVTVSDTNHCTATYTVNLQNHSGTTTPSVMSLNNDSVVCLGDSILLLATLGGLNTAHWNTGDSSVNIYAHQSGIYFITALDSFGCRAGSDTIRIKGDSIIHLRISGTTAAHTAQLSSTQIGMGSYLWDLGNGHDTTTAAPGLGYTYTDSGSYTVRLITHQNCGTDTALLTVHIADPLSIIYINGGEVKVNVRPNPFHSTTVIDIEQPAGAESLNAKLYDSKGGLIKDMGVIVNSNLTIERGGLPVGQYLLRLNNTKINTTLRLVIE